MSFVVAHRLSTIRHADLLLLLEKGRIIERGHHEALVRQGGVYAGMFREFPAKRWREFVGWVKLKTTAIRFSPLMNTSSLRAACFAGALTAVALFATSSAVRGQNASQIYTEATQNYDAGDIAGAKQKLRLALEVDKNFRPAAALLSKITADEKQAGAQPVGVSAQTLSKVIVPIEIKDTSLQTAIEILRQRISEKSGGKVEVNFVVKLPPDLANKRVSLHLDHVPASEVMRYLGSVAGVDFKIEQYAVMVVPASAPPSAGSSPGVSPAP